MSCIAVNSTCLPASCVTLSCKTISALYCTSVGPETCMSGNCTRFQHVLEPCIGSLSPCSHTIAPQGGTSTIQLQKVHSRKGALFFLFYLPQPLWAAMLICCPPSLACVPLGQSAQEMCGRLLLDRCSLASRDEAQSQLLPHTVLHEAASSGCLPMEAALSRACLASADAVRQAMSYSC